MKFYWNIPPELKEHVNKELLLSSDAFAKGELRVSWRHLERAHILGQPYPIEHTLVHWKMLQFALKMKNTREIIGQIPRLLVGGVKSFVGNIPIGNTGGADVPPLQPMEIPQDLQQILNQYK